MSDPSKLDTAEWVGILGLIGGFITGIAAWIHRMTKPYNDRIAALEGTVYGVPGQEGHDTKLAVIRANQDHMTNRLDEIRECTNTTNEKLSDLSDTLTQVLLAVRKK